MIRKLIWAVVAAVGVSLTAGSVAEAGGGHHGHGHHGHWRGPHGPGHRHGHWHGYRGHYPRRGVVYGRPVYPYPVSPGYPVYGYPPVYSPYNSAFGIDTGNFSLYLAR